MKRVLFIIFSYILLPVIYLAISINISPKYYKTFSLVSFVVLICFAVWGQVVIIRDKNKTKMQKFFNVITNLIIIIFLFRGKFAIDRGNLEIFSVSKQEKPVFNMIMSAYERRKSFEKYDSLFSTIKSNNNTIYYTKEFEPALKLVEAYLDKAKKDNVKVFGDFSISDLTVKFDYDEEVFRKRNPIMNDLAGLYNKNEKTAYVIIKDCYSNALASNMKSGYFKETLMHEYTHHVIHEFLALMETPMDKIPTWFEEGICEYIGLEGGNGPAPVKMVNFGELNTLEQWADYNNKEYPVYHQSHYAIRQLIAMKNEGIIKDILIKLKYEDFNTAFKEATGISFEDFEKALNEDFKNDWKKYNKIEIVYTGESNRDIKIECLEKYTKNNLNNIDALLDLANLYKITGNTEKEFLTLKTAVEKDPKNNMGWHGLACYYQRVQEFDKAIEAFEKDAALDKKNETPLVNIALTYLTKDADKALEAIEKAKKINNSNYTRNLEKQIKSFRDSIKNGKPYEGGLILLKSDAIYGDSLIKGIIEKLLGDYPDIKNSARSELEKINSKIK